MLIEMMLQILFQNLKKNHQYYLHIIFNVYWNRILYQISTINSVSVILIIFHISLNIYNFWIVPFILTVINCYKYTSLKNTENPFLL